MQSRLFLPFALALGCVLMLPANVARADNDPKKQTAVFLIGEDEYDTKTTLPEFAVAHLVPKGIHCVFLHADEDRSQGFKDIERLRDADVLVLSVRRRTLPKSQMDEFRRYVTSKKPIVAIRTSSHGFALRDTEPPAGHEVWPEFDREVLGCHYNNHHGNKGADDPKTFVWVTERAAKHPIVADIDWKPKQEVHVTSWLYKSRPLSKTCELLMSGRVEGREPNEPVTWTNLADDRRVFYTSLGHPDDFKMRAFQELLTNGVLWSLKRDKTE